jgi:RNA polymerase sigma factor (sigma-70 family)
VLLATYLERRADLVRLFAGRLRSVSRAEDLVQAMYERLLSAPVDAPIANPLAYLFRLGSNLMLDDVRQARRQGARERAWSDLQGMQTASGRGSEQPSPEEAAIARQRLRLLLDAVDRLPPQARRAFRLHKIEGLSHVETARAMGISRSAVEKQMSLALKLLAEFAP